MVRYMIPCDDWGTALDDPLCIKIFGLLSNAYSTERVYEKGMLACVLRDPGCAFGDPGL